MLNRWVQCSQISIPRIEDWMSEATQQEQRTLPWCLRSPWCHARVMCHAEVTQGHVTISSHLSPVTEKRISRLLNSEEISPRGRQLHCHCPGIWLVTQAQFSHLIGRQGRISLGDGSPILTGGRWKQFLCDLKCKQSSGLSGHPSYHTNTIVVKFCR